ncbi:MAG: hypothetical protein IPM79_09235 [Polyangiaceae bacterium]|nr:hypothetical protein [Polyangiaceae bacterium]
MTSALGVVSLNAAPIMCPYCRTHAPLVYRGIHAYCAACGAPRTVLSGASLTHAGKPSRVGATVAKAFGAATLALGLFIALLLGLLISIASTTAGLIVGGSIAFFTIAAALLFRAGGKSLRRPARRHKRPSGRRRCSRSRRRAGVAFRRLMRRVRSRSPSRRPMAC